MINAYYFTQIIKIFAFLCKVEASLVRLAFCSPLALCSPSTCNIDMGETNLCLSQGLSRLRVEFEVKSSQV